MRFMMPYIRSKDFGQLNYLVNFKFPPSFPWRCFTVWNMSLLSTVYTHTDEVHKGLMNGHSEHTPVWLWPGSTQLWQHPWKPVSAASKPPLPAPFQKEQLFWLLIPKISISGLFKLNYRAGIVLCLDFFGQCYDCEINSCWCTQLQFIHCCCSLGFHGKNTVIAFAIPQLMDAHFRVLVVTAL